MRWNAQREAEHGTVCHPAPESQLTLDVLQVGHERVFALGDVAGPAAVQGPEASGANFPATAQVSGQNTRTLRFAGCMPCQSECNAVADEGIVVEALL